MENVPNISEEWQFLRGSMPFQPVNETHSKAVLVKKTAILGAKYPISEGFKNIYVRPKNYKTTNIFAGTMILLSIS